MARWDSKIKGVAPLLGEVFDTDNPPTAERFLELRDGIFSLLSAHPFFDEDAEWTSDEAKWTEAVQEIKYTSDVKDLNEMLEGVYDEADKLRVWIDPID